MDWSDLGSSIADMAPMLGSAFGPGGTVIGSLISSAFGGSGKETPDELDKLIKADPQAALKLREIESNNKVELEKLIIQGKANELAADTSRIESVNATMRQEAISGDAWQRRWRPFWGYISGVAFFVQILAIVWVMIESPAAAAAVIASIGSLQIFWGVPLAILGVSAYQRGKEKRAALGEQAQPLLNMFNRK